MGDPRIAQYPRGEPMTVGEYWAYLRVRDASQWFHHRTLAVFLSFIVLARLPLESPLAIAFATLMLVSNVSIALFVRQRQLEAFPERAKVRTLVPVGLCLVPFGTTLFAVRFEEWLKAKFRRAGVTAKAVSVKSVRDVVAKELGEEPHLVCWSEPPVVR